MNSCRSFCEPLEFILSCLLILEVVNQLLWLRPMFPLDRTLVPYEAHWEAFWVDNGNPFSASWRIFILFDGSSTRYLCSSTGRHFLSASNLANGKHTFPVPLNFRQGKRRRDTCPLDHIPQCKRMDLRHILRTISWLPFSSRWSCRNLVESVFVLSMLLELMKIRSARTFHKSSNRRHILVLVSHV